jgi:hypothetical protein
MTHDERVTWLWLGATLSTTAYAALLRPLQGRRLTAAAFTFVAPIPIAVLELQMDSSSGWRAQELPLRASIEGFAVWYAFTLLACLETLAIAQLFARFRWWSYLLGVVPLALLARLVTIVLLLSIPRS